MGGSDGDGERRDEQLPNPDAPNRDTLYMPINFAVETYMGIDRIQTVN